METKPHIKLAIFAGEIMLKNGAETFRAEDTISRILQVNGYKINESFVTSTGIFVCVEDDSGIITIVRRIKSRTINLSKIAKTNDISRKFVTGIIDSDDAYRQLVLVNDEKPYNALITSIAYGMSGLGFTYILSSSYIESIIAFFIGVITSIVIDYGVSRNYSQIKNTVVTSFVFSIMPFILSIILTINISTDTIIVGCLMALVPGVSLVNGVRDLLTGDYLAATSRILEVIIISVSIAIGVGSSLFLANLYLGGI